MFLVDLTFDLIYDFMKEEKISLKNVEFNFNGNYKVNMQITKEQEEKFKAKLLELSQSKKRMDMLVKNEHGSYEKMDKFYKKSKGSFRSLFNRRLNKFNEILNLVKGEVSIISMKNNKSK